MKNLKINVKEKVGEGISYVKSRWSNPAKGEYTNLQEFLSYCFGTMGICSFTYLCNDVVSFASGYFCGSIMEIKLADFATIAIIALIVKYLTLYIESISMTIFENLGHLTKKKAKVAAISYCACIAVGIVCYLIPSAPFESIIKGLPQIFGNMFTVMGVGGLVNWFLRSKLCKKYGRYKPFMMIYGVPIALLTCAMVYVPTTLDYTTKIVLLHLLVTLRNRFSVLYYDTASPVVALISPNMVERQKYYSIGGIFLGFLRSIFRIIFPILIVGTGGYLSIKSYRVFVPILAVAGVLLGLSFAKVKERVASNTEVAPKIDFKKSAKSLFSNKYFWIINLATAFNLWNGLSDGVINYIFIYNMRIEWIIGFLSVIGITSVIGNLLTPVLIKKFEKRTCIIFMRSIWAAITACYLIAIRLNSVPLLVLFIFIRSAFSAASNGISNNLTADVLDYHQWKTGERADNIQSVFSWITTPIITLLGLVSPFVFAKVGFTSDWDVLFDSSIFTQVMSAHVILTVTGLIISTVPFIFYNYTKADHDRYVEEIAEREDTAKAEAMGLTLEEYRASLEAEAPQTETAVEDNEVKEEVTTV